FKLNTFTLFCRSPIKVGKPCVHILGSLPIKGSQRKLRRVHFPSQPCNFSPLKHISHMEHNQLPTFSTFSM
ncbi:hypothetical protein VIGAN_11140200, partial [Vigna angularis var. angularis]